MKLIVGLGNPGKKYEKTRHNVGFMTLSILRFDLKAPEFKFNEKFNAEIAITDNQFINRVTNSQESHDRVADGPNRVADGPAISKVILIKPQTFMNESGKAVKTIADYYKVGVNDIFVVYDDIDLPIGTIRIGRFDSAGGHQGVQSIIDYLKSSDFIRFRVGIKNNKTNKQTADLSAIGLRRRRLPAGKFVLQKFGLLEKKKINDSLKKTVEAIKLALTEPIEKVVSKYN